MSTRPVRVGGFTLIEAILFMVIVGIGATAIISVMGVANSRSADPILRKQAQMIAESLMEEVQLARITYCDPASANYDAATSSADCASGGTENWGAEASNVRPYDNVNDYVTAGGAAQNAFNNGSGVLVDATGTAIGGGNYTATLAIEPVALNNIAITNAASADNNAFQITVTVSYGNESVVLTGYRTRYAPTDQ